MISKADNTNSGQSTPVDMAPKSSPKPLNKNGYFAQNPSSKERIEGMSYWAGVQDEQYIKVSPVASDAISVKSNGTETSTSSTTVTLKSPNLKAKQSANSSQDSLKYLPPLPESSNSSVYHAYLLPDASSAPQKTLKNQLNGVANRIGASLCVLKNKALSFLEKIIKFIIGAASTMGKEMGQLYGSSTAWMNTKKDQTEISTDVFVINPNTPNNSYNAFGEKDTGSEKASDGPTVQ